METRLKQVSSVEYDLEIDATAEDLAPELKLALRQQRTRTNLKGFRPGKVPISVVKKMYGRVLAYGVAERSIQNTYEEEVMGSGELDVLGQPKVTELDYEMDGDLHAVVRFGVRPEIKIEEGVPVESMSRLAHTVTEEEIEEEIEGILEREADLVASEEPVGPDDYVEVDLQEIDEETGTPIVGRRQEDATFHLGDERMKPAFRDALVGTSKGDAVRVQLPGEDESDLKSYEVTVKEVRRRVLPELTDELASKASGGQAETADALRGFLREEMQKAWNRRSDDLVESMVVERIVEQYPVDVPESVIEMYLDAFVEDVKKQAGENLPESFDEAEFREERRDDALRQSRWMLIRDHVIEEHGFIVTEADHEAYFADQATGDVTPDMMKRYYASMGLMERINHRLLTQKVIEHLKQRFEFEDRDRETFESERKAKLEALRAGEESDEAGGFSRFMMPLKRVWNQLRKP